jgi:hypothetical protein
MLHRRRGFNAVSLQNAVDPKPVESCLSDRHDREQAASSRAYLLLKMCEPGSYSVTIPPGTACFDIFSPPPATKT